MAFVRFLLLLLPLVELATLILLGQRVGVAWTLLWVLASGLLGVLIIQRQGWSMLQQVQQRMAQERSPFGILQAGLWGVLAGLLLLFPGLITDALALPCLLLAWRSRNRPGPGEPGGPQVWQRGEHTIIEGEWRSAEPRDSSDPRIERD